MPSVERKRIAAKGLRSSVYRDFNWDCMDEKTACEATAALGRIRGQVMRVSAAAAPASAYMRRPNHLISSKHLMELAGALRAAIEGLETEITAAYGSCCAPVCMDAPGHN